MKITKMDFRNYQAQCLSKFFHKVGLNLDQKLLLNLKIAKSHNLNKLSKII